MASKRKHGVDRMLSKLQLSIDAGNYYEAHQMYRCLYFRLLDQKKYAELLDMLYDGAMWLLTHNQLTSGADLAILLVDGLVKSETEPSIAMIEKLSRLFEMIGPYTLERKSFLDNALLWSGLPCEEHRSGNPFFHKRVAQIFWKEKNYTLARHHFLHSADGSVCATMLVDLHQQEGYASEADLFIAQTVFQYLCLEDERSAKEVFYCYTTQHPNINAGPPYVLPLLNFICFLLRAVECRNFPAFLVLIEKYDLSIKRDLSYIEYLNKIAEIYFGIFAEPGTQGLFGNVMQYSTSGLVESDSDDDSTRIAVRASTSQQVDPDERYGQP